MNKRKFFTVYILLLLILSFPLTSQELKNDAIFQKIKVTYTLHNDGSIRTDHYQNIKLLTTQAVSRFYGESSIFYNPRFQKLTIDRSETTMADGTVIPTPENGYNEVLPRSVHHAPGYAFLREMVVSHTGLEREAVIQLRYHIDTEPEFIPWLMGEEIFGKMSPVESYTVMVKVPKEKKLHYKLLNNNSKPEITTHNGFTVYQWNLKDCNALLREDNHQDFAEFAPRLLFSTCEDWQTLTNHLKRSLKSKYTLSENTKSVLLQGITDLDSKNRILELQNKIVDDISNTDLDLSLLGYRFSSAENTFQRNHGTIFDKAVLLSSLLSSQEIKADIALVSHCDQFCKEIPSLFQFDQARVIASTEKEEYFILAPHKEQSWKGRIDLAGKVLLGLGDDNGKLMMVRSLGLLDNYLKITGMLRVDEDLTLTGDITLSVNGTFYPYYTVQKNSKSFLSRKINSILPDTEINEITINYQNDTQAEFEISVSNKNAFQKLKNSSLYKSFRLNSVMDDWHITSAYRSRTTPLELPAPVNEHILLVLNIPENIILSSQDKNYDFSCDQGHIMYRIQQNDHKIIMERQLTVKDKVIKPSEYSDFRTILVNQEAEDHRTFIVEID